jgi:8-oxo-dGTP diphosphatase
MACECDHLCRRWNPFTGRCESCGQKFRCDAFSASGYNCKLPPGHAGPHQAKNPSESMSYAWEDPPTTEEKLGHQTAETMDEATFLKEYKKKTYCKPSVTVDLCIFTVSDSLLKVLLIKRKGHPFKDFWALPGGFVHVNDAPDQGESLEDAARRELSEETGLPAKGIWIEQLHTFGNPRRDPRTRVISVAYYALIPATLQVQAGDDAADAQWFLIGDVVSPPLAFDHATILVTAIRRIREKIDSSMLAFSLIPPTFTKGELRSVYEAVKGKTCDPRNFNRHFRHMIDDGIIRQAPGKRVTTTRPASLFEFVNQAG